jgi:MOSC domain-containing protein YiiM
VILLEITIKNDNTKMPCAVDLCEMTYDVGIAGQVMPKNRQRQISMMTEKTKDEIASLHTPGLCMPRFFANFVLDRTAGENALLPGTRLRIGSAVVVVSDQQKECFEECVLRQSKTHCPLRTGCCFAWVEKDGVAALGDSVTVEV